MTLTIHPVKGIPEVTEGMDLGPLIGDICSSSEFGLSDGDVLVVTQKIVSKAEGAMVEIDQTDHSRTSRSWNVRLFGYSAGEVS